MGNVCWEDRTAKGQRLWFGVGVSVSLIDPSQTCVYLTFTISLLRVWEHRLYNKVTSFPSSHCWDRSVCLKCVQLPHAISWSYVYIFTHFIKIINYYISIFIIDAKLQSFIIMYSLLSTGFTKPHITWILQGQHNLRMHCDKISNEMLSVCEKWKILPPRAAYRSMSESSYLKHKMTSESCIWWSVCVYIFNQLLPLLMSFIVRN